jgi:biopolymer transport protein ExbD
MPKLQIQKKSTWVDMTAFVDVSFLILSFFMLATKFKPPETVSIENPKSVSSEKVAEKDVFKVSFDQEGRCFISFSTDETAKDRMLGMLGELEKQKRIQPLTNEDKARFVTYAIGGIGVPFSQLNSLLRLSDADFKALKQPGIPVKDTADIQLTTWISALLEGNNSRRPENIMLNGDNSARYPEFKNILTAFKRNRVFSFKLITSMEPVPSGSPLEKTRLKKQSE